MADLALGVRLTGDAGQLVGQLNGAQAAQRGLTAETGKAAEAAKRAETALDALAQAQATAKVATDAARAAYTAGEISLAAYNRMVLASKANLGTFAAEHTAAQATVRKMAAGVTDSHTRMSNSSMIMQHVVRGSLDQFASGASIAQVFAQHVGMIGEAAAMSGSSMGALGKFLSGPWGMAATVAITVGASLVGMLLQHKAAAKDAAAGQMDLRDALLKVGDGSNEALKALKDYNAEQHKSRDEADAMIKSNLALASSQLTLAINTREAIKSRIEQVAQANVQGGTLAARSIAMQAPLFAQDAAIATLQQAQRNLMIRDAARDAKAAADPIQAINNKFDDMEAAATRAAAGNDKLAASLKGLLTQYEQQRKLAIDAQRQQGSAALDNAQAAIGDMTALIKQLFPGAQITSTNTGIHTKNSDHYKNRAVDFVVPGMMNAAGTPQVEERLKDAGVRIRRNVHGTEQFFGPGRDPGGAGDRSHETHFHLAWEGGIDPDKAMEKIKKAQDELNAFGEREAATIANISGQFDAQPALVDRVAKAMRDLTKIQEDLNKKQPAGFRDMIAAADAAKSVVQAALVKPFADMVKASQQSRAQQELTLAGRDDEAEALKRILQLQTQVGFVTKDQRDTILQNVEAETRLNDLLKSRTRIVGAYTGAIEGVRGSLEQLLGGGTGKGDFMKSLMATFQQARGKILTEQLFGPALRELEDAVKKETGIKSSVDIMTQGVTSAGQQASNLATALEQAAQRVGATFGGVPGAAGAAGTAAAGGQSFAERFNIGGLDAPATPTTEALQSVADATNEIVVTGHRLERGVMAMDPARFAQLMAGSLVAPLVPQLKNLLGNRLGGTIGTALQSGLAGYMQGGIAGGILGGLQGLIGKDTKLGGTLGKGVAGAGTGTLVSGIGNMFGLGLSQTGAQIGGALGGMLPIPGGAIIGSLAGGVLGKLLGGLFPKKGSVTFNGAAITGSMGQAGLIKQSTDAANGIMASLQQIAQQLGGSLNPSAGRVSIGVRNGAYTVDPTGSGQTKASFVQNFGTDAEAAARAAMADLIKDGVLQGLDAAVMKALQSSPDIQKGIDEALKVKELEKALGGFSGAAQDAFNQFEAQAKDRLRLATQYGLDVVKVEQLNGKERLALRQQLEQQAFGSLQDLLDRMKSGDLFEGSAVDQRNVLLGQIDAQRAKAAGGEAGAADKLAQMLEQLNTLSQTVFGTSGGFAGDRDTIQSTAQGVITLLKGQLDQAQGTANPQLDATNSLLDENNGQNAQQIAALNAIRDALTNPAATAAAATTGWTADKLAALAYSGNPASPF